MQVNLSIYGSEIKSAQDKVYDSKDTTNWVLYGYEKGTNDLKVEQTGDGGLEELVEEFEDGKIQYAFVRVIDENTKLPKFIFISWCGEGVPVQKKGLFQSHLNDVRGRLKGNNLEIMARNEIDLDPKLILKKVRDYGGANYSHKQDDLTKYRKDIADSGPVAPVGSNYTRPEVIRSSKPQMPAPMKTADDIRREREEKDRELMNREKEEFAARSRAQDAVPTPTYDNKPAIVNAPINRAAPPTITQKPSAFEGLSGVALIRAQREAKDREDREREAERAKAIIPDSVEKPVEKSYQPATQSSSVSAAANVFRNANNPPSQPPLFNKPTPSSRPPMNTFTPSVSSADTARKEREAADRELIEREKRIQQERENSERLLEQQRQREEEAYQAEIRKRAEEQQRYEEEQQRYEEQKRYEEEQQRLHSEAEFQRQKEAQEAEYARQQEEEARRLQWEAEEAAKHAEFQRQQEEEARRLEYELSQQQSHVVAQERPPSSNIVTAVCIYEYVAAEENEMSINVGELVSDIEMLDPGWWQGCVHDPNTGSIIKAGLFPSNYVQLTEANVAPVEPVEEQHVPVEEHHAPIQTQGFSVVALYDYTAGEENEISFAVGETISNVQLVTDDWWSGETYNGMVGLFPANYVRAL